MLPDILKPINFVFTSGDANFMNNDASARRYKIVKAGEEPSNPELSGVEFESWIELKKFIRSGAVNLQNAITPDAGGAHITQPVSSGEANIAPDS